MEAVSWPASVLTLIISPTTPLAGRWSEFLPWGILVVGVLFTLGLVAMTERLIRRRQHAEQLAEENRRLYGEQRNVSFDAPARAVAESSPDNRRG